MLYQYLRKDVEKNGPAPAELDFFYGLFEFATRLERVTGRQAMALFESEDETVRDILPTIQAARRHFGTTYENW